jgi:predicted RNase H-like nuclease (RuvC/YqgF family)
MDTMRSEVDRLKNCSIESKRKSRIVQSQIRTLCEERADFLAKIQDQHREMMTLKKQLGIAEKENEDIMDLNDEENHRPRFTVAELKEVLAERNELKKRVNDLEEELVGYRPMPEQPLGGGGDDVEVPAKVDPMVESIYDPYDLPVQGPLPQEPSDAPWKKSTTANSGVRKL